MKQSNIFTYVELSKMVESLSLAGTSGKLKERLKAQAAYFNILDPKYFSEQLSAEWEAIVIFIKKGGSRLNEEGRVVANPVTNTIDCLTEDECNDFVGRLYHLYDKLKSEFV